MEAAVTAVSTSAKPKGRSEVLRYSTKLNAAVTEGPR